MEPVIFRAVERTIAVAIGGLCVYLGYRLFLHIPEQREGEGKINLPGGISIFITRVGPGVFFALFGAVIVAFSIYHGIVYFHKGTNDRVMATGSPRSNIEYYSGLTQRHTMDNREQTDRQRRELRLEMEFLNTLPSMLKDRLNEQQIRDVKYRSESIKLVLMKAVWGPDWGDFGEFKLWIESDSPDPVPEGLEAPAAYYRSGQEAVK
ncbi:MAG: hypothetical protein GXP46_01480 [Deferribacteres bacterium]|nr:hypothetical protein [Deferribacteres bacterium]